MHRNPSKTYLNWSTPAEMVRLLEIADKKELFDPIYKNFLWNTMIATSTGSNKLKGLLPSNAIVGHKTGSSDRMVYDEYLSENYISQEGER